MHHNIPRYNPLIMQPPQYNYNNAVEITPNFEELSLYPYPNPYRTNILKYGKHYDGKHKINMISKLSQLYTWAYLNKLTQNEMLTVIITEYLIDEAQERYHAIKHKLNTLPKMVRWLIKNGKEPNINFHINALKNIKLIHDPETYVRKYRQLESKMIEIYNQHIKYFNNKPRPTLPNEKKRYGFLINGLPNNMYNEIRLRYEPQPSYNVSQLLRIIKSFQSHFEHYQYLNKPSIIHNKSKYNINKYNNSNSKYNNKHYNKYNKRKYIYKNKSKYYNKKYKRTGNKTYVKKMNKYKRKYNQIKKQHTKNDINNKTQKQSNNDKTNKYNDKHDKNTKVKCYNCGKYGHYANKCKVKSKNDKYKKKKYDKKTKNKSYLTLKNDADDSNNSNIDTDTESDSDSISSTSSNDSFEHGFDSDSDSDNEHNTYFNQYNNDNNDKNNNDSYSDNNNDNSSDNNNSSSKQYNSNNDSYNNAKINKTTKNNPSSTSNTCESNNIDKNLINNKSNNKQNYFNHKSFFNNINKPIPIHKNDIKQNEMYLFKTKSNILLPCIIIKIKPLTIKLLTERPIIFTTHFSKLFYYNHKLIKTKIKKSQCYINKSIPKAIKKLPNDKSISKAEIQNVINKHIEYKKDNIEYIKDGKKKKRNYKPQKTLGRINVKLIRDLYNNNKIPPSKLIDITFKKAGTIKSFLDPGSTDTIINKSYYEQYLSSFKLYTHKKPLNVINAGDADFNLYHYIIMYAQHPINKKYIPIEINIHENDNLPFPILLSEECCNKLGYKIGLFDHDNKLVYYKHNKQQQPFNDLIDSDDEKMLDNPAYHLHEVDFKNNKTEYEVSTSDTSDDNNNEHSYFQTDKIIKPKIKISKSKYKPSHKLINEYNNIKNNIKSLKFMVTNFQKNKNHTTEEYELIRDKTYALNESINLYNKHVQHHNNNIIECNKNKYRPRRKYNKRRYKKSINDKKRCYFNTQQSLNNINNKLINAQPSSNNKPNKIYFQINKNNEPIQTKLFSYFNTISNVECKYDYIDPQTNKPYLIEPYIMIPINNKFEPAIIESVFKDNIHYNVRNVRNNNIIKINYNDIYKYNEYYIDKEIENDIVTELKHFSFVNRGIHDVPNEVLNKIKDEFVEKDVTMQSENAPNNNSEYDYKYFVNEYDKVKHQFIKYEKQYNIDLSPKTIDWYNDKINAFLNNIDLTIKENINGFNHIINIYNDINERKGYYIALRTKYLLLKYFKVIALHSYHIGIIPNVKYEVQLKENAKRKFFKPYKSTYEENEVIEKQCAKLLKAGNIRPSNSPWASPVIVVVNKDNTLRMCIDYSYINSQTIRKPFPCPDIRRLINSFNKCIIFSMLDINKAFYNVAVEESSIPYTSFITNSGQYECLVMPFGGVNCPPTWAQATGESFRNVPDLKKYVDDFSIGSHSYTAHFLNIELIFIKCIETNLKLKISKCEFFKDEIQFVGHIIDKNGSRPNKKYIHQVFQMKKPTNRDSFLSFRGTINYLSKFIPGLSYLFSKISKLGKKNNKFEWGAAEDIIFYGIQNAVDNAQPLAHPDYNSPFIIKCDASNYAGGAGLYQMREVNGKLEEVPIEFMSILFTPAECKTHITDKELVIVIKAIKKWRYHLFKRFDVYSDAKTVVSLFKRTNTPDHYSVKHYRWATILNQYDFNVHHLPGRLNIVEDYLSRYLDYDKINSLHKQYESNFGGVEYTKSTNNIQHENKNNYIQHLYTYYNNKTHTKKEDTKKENINIDIKYEHISNEISSPSSSSSSESSSPNNIENENINNIDNEALNELNYIKPNNTSFWNLLNKYLYKPILNNYSYGMNKKKNKKKKKRRKQEEDKPGVPFLKQSDDDYIPNEKIKETKTKKLRRSKRTRNKYQIEQQQRIDATNIIPKKKKKKLLKRKINTKPKASKNEIISTDDEVLNAINDKNIINVEPNIIHQPINETIKIKTKQRKN